MYLLPIPQTVSLTSGKYILRYETKIILQSDLKEKEFNYSKILRNHISNLLGYELAITKADSPKDNSIFLEIDESLKSEEYSLSIHEKGIKIKAGDSKGLLNGVQTLRQIISQQGAVIDTCVIQDYPEILNRGFYHDVTRGRIPTLETLKKLADKVSYYKINQLQLYIEHSFLFENFSEMLRDDTPLRAEEIIEFDNYCKSLNIELVPSIASFGHLHKLLCTKSYSHLCELEDPDKAIFSYIDRMAHHTIDVTNEESFEVIKTMLLEFIPLFSSNQFNVCADETFDLGKGKSKELKEQIGADQLYVDFLKKICDVVVEKGKRPMFWGDIVLKSPEKIKELPENVICLNWDYDANVKVENIKKFADLNATQYLCPGVQGWKRFFNSYEYSFRNISKMAEYAHKYKVLGFLNTDWGDYGHINNPEFSMIGMIYGAALSWNSKKISYEDINKQISVLEYGDKSELIVDIVQKISTNDLFGWESAVHFKEMSEKNVSEERLLEIFEKFNKNNIADANRQVQDLIIELYSLTPELKNCKIKDMKLYLNASNAIVLFNTLGATIGKYKYNMENDVAKNPKELAVEIENWFREYCEIWRRDNKESELFLIRNVITWHCDLLRDL